MNPTPQPPTRPRKYTRVCDCGKPAGKRLDSAWVCDRCYEIDHCRAEAETKRQNRFIGESPECYIFRVHGRQVAVL
jgi:hypothetical protein